MYFAVFLGCLFCLHVTASSWTESPPAYTIARNNFTTTLRCGLRNPLSEQYPKWYSRERDMYVSAGSRIVSCDTCSITNGTDDKYYLTLNPVSTEDEGEWQCRSFLATPQYLSTQLIVIEQSPSCLLIGPVSSSYQVIHGSSVTFRCDFGKAAPPGELQWIKNGDIVVARGNRPLSWTTTISSQGDSYNCYFDHSTLSSSPSCSADILLDVQYPPVIDVSISSGDKQGKVREGEKFTAQCQVIDGNPHPLIIWTKDGSTYVHGTTLTFGDIGRSDSGVFICRGTTTYYNGNTAIDEKVITIDVQYPPTSPDVIYLNDGKVVEGYTLNATCIGNNGNPGEYTYRWETCGGIISSQPLLQIEGIQRNQSGVYTCITTNDMYDIIGSSATHIQIDVQYLPTAVGRTRFGAVIGESVTMVLTVDANPLPVTFGRWVMGNVTLNKSDTSYSSVVTIEKVAEDHFGTYFIPAENVVGMATFMVTLDKRGAPESPELHLLKQTYESLTIELVSRFHGGDIDGVLYYLQYRQLKNGSFQQWQDGTKNTILAVGNLSSGSIYEFQAYAGNRFGNSDMSDLKYYKTYDLPEITFDLETGKLSWTPHENEIYDCVKIETKNSNTNWISVDDCVERHITDYTTTDKAAVYRLSYCVKGGACEDAIFHPSIKAHIPKSSSNRGGVVAGTVTSSFLMVVTVLVVIAVVKKRRMIRQPDIAEGGKSHTAESGTDNIITTHQNQDTVDDTYASLVTSTKSKSVYMKINKPGNHIEDESNAYTELTVEKEAESLYMKSGQIAFEFPRNKLQIRNDLYEGEHHKVILAKAWHIGGTYSLSEVVVKMSKGNNSKEELDILQESILLKNIPNHPNVIKLLGVCTEMVPTYIIMERLSYGSMEMFLKGIRSKDDRFSIVVTEMELLSFSIDIAKGMEHLSGLQIVHRYLTPKHILVDGTLHCKISNFGYAFDVIESESFFEKAKYAIPWQWMAIETLDSHVFSLKSDVWSFGVVLWQLINLGGMPYITVDEENVLRQLKSGYRLPKEEHCGKETYDHMNQCWQRKPCNRPTFTDLVTAFETLINDAKNFMDMSKFQESAT